MEAKPTITIGYPPKTFEFVCWVEQTRGVHKAPRNKEKILVPSYRSIDREIVLDITQAITINKSTTTE